MIEDVKPLIAKLQNIEPLKGQLNRDIEYIAPTTQEKTITPKREQQIVFPDNGVFALSKVTIEAVTNDIDSNIVPENIKVGTEILGVQGSYEGLTPSVVEDTLIFSSNVTIEGGEIIL